MKLHGRMSIGTAERRFAEMLDIQKAEVIIRNSQTKRDIRDNAKISTLRRFSKKSN